MSGPYLRPSGSQIDEFQTFGHPGRYIESVDCKNTQVDFTGSNYGYGAVIVGESSAAGTIILSGGGSINIAHLTVGTIYELSPRKITESGNKSLYALKRQQ